MTALATPRPRILWTAKTLSNCWRNVATASIASSSGESCTAMISRGVLTIALMTRETVFKLVPSFLTGTKMVNRGCCEGVVIWIWTCCQYPDFVLSPLSAQYIGCVCADSPLQHAQTKFSRIFRIANEADDRFGEALPSQVSACRARSHTP